jgi:O-antigen ligase
MTTIASPAPAPVAPTRWRADARHAAAPAALLWALIVLMVVPEGLDYGLVDGEDAPAGAGAVSLALWLGLLGGSLVIIVKRWSLARALLRRLNPYLLLLVALAVASIAWSIDPGLSVRRVYRLITIVATCVAFVLVGWHAQRCQNVVRPALTLLLGGSLVFGLAYPALAIHGQAAAELAGAWRGLANHKNGLGALAGIGLVFWVHAGLARQARWLPLLIGIAVASACLMLSRSSTSIVAAAFAIGFLVFTMRGPRALRGWMPALVWLLVALLLVVTLGLLDLLPGGAALTAPIAALTDKDRSFTGRSEIWTIIGEHIRLRPWLGSGYGAYWTAAATPGTDAYAFVQRMAGFYPFSAHNGYLDVANDLGGIGLATLLAYIVTHASQSLRLLPAGDGQAQLYLALFFQQMITNLSETHWFGVLSVDFVFMTLASTALARGLLQQRFVARLGAPGRR